MDEFANVSLPDDFDKILSVMRSRSVSVSIILQNLAQLKALFEKQWESIVGNCDEFLYLGGNEQSTHKYVSELLGKATIDTNTYGKSEGRSGSYSTNYQISGRELLTPDEVRMLDNQYAINYTNLNERTIDMMCKAESSGEIFSIMQNTHNGRLIDKIGYVYASDISPRVKYRLAKKNMHFSNNPSVVMISYMFVAETELMNIITLIEGTRYELDNKLTQSLLIK